MAGDVIGKLMQANSAQEQIIKDQAGIIDELFQLVCQYANLDGLEGIGPLLTTMKEAAERGRQCQTW